ncbi:MAG: glycosyltransferase [Rhodanobacteraceae bacterium]|nr:glycosyltransferase [Rhodanobacteraceae bacterium]
MTSRCGGPEDIVREGVDGFVVDANDASALARRLQQLAADRSLLVQPERTVPHLLSVDAHVDALIALYRDALTTVSATNQA